MRNFCRRMMYFVGFGFFFTAATNAVQAQDILAAVYTEFGMNALNSSETAQSSVLNAQNKRTEQAPANAQLIVDRIDGDTAIIETSAGAVRFPLEALPDGAAHEGAVLEWRHTQSAENHRISAAHARIERMKAASKGR